MIGLNKHTNFRTVVLPTPINDITGLLAFLDNKNAYMKYINELKKFTDEANQAIETVGKAREIDGLLSEAKQLRDAAKAEHAEERTKVEDIVGAAETKAQSIVADAEAIATKMTSEAENLMAEAKEKASVLADDRVTVSAQMKSAKKLEAELDKRQKQIDKVEAEIADKKRLLAQL